MKDVDFWNKYPILILLLLIVLRSIYGRNQCFVYSKALIPNEYVMIIAAFNQKLQPIFAPGTFLKRNLKLPNKICPAMGIESLPNIGTEFLVIKLIAACIARMICPFTITYDLAVFGCWDNGICPYAV